jgi:lysophospholipase L1-like esterase
MKKNILIKTISILSLLTLLLFLFGFGWTMNNQLVNQKTPKVQPKIVTLKEKDHQGKTIVALGDSLTRGTGDVEGKGYIGYLVDELQEKTDQKISIQNLGVKGFRSNQLLDQINQKGIQEQIKDADVILMTIGGNDLFQSGQTLMKMNLAEIDELKKQYLLNLDKIITQLRSINSDATIFLVGLYNPFIEFKDAEMMTKVVRQWNYETISILDKQPKTVYVPTFDLFQLKVNDYLYTDKFHPNAEGYKLIAERVASLITW